MLGLTEQDAGRGGGEGGGQSKTQGAVAEMAETVQDAVGELPPSVRRAIAMIASEAIAIASVRRGGGAVDID